MPAPVLPKPAPVPQAMPKAAPITPKPAPAVPVIAKPAQTAAPKAKVVPTPSRKAPSVPQAAPKVAVPATVPTKKAAPTLPKPIQPSTLPKPPAAPTKSVPTAASITPKTDRVGANPKQGSTPKANQAKSPTTNSVARPAEGPTSDRPRTPIPPPTAAAILKPLPPSKPNMSVIPPRGLTPTQRREATQKNLDGARAQHAKVTEAAKAFEDHQKMDRAASAREREAAKAAAQATANEKLLAAARAKARRLSSAEQAKLKPRLDDLEQKAKQAKEQSDLAGKRATTAEAEARKTSGAALAAIKAARIGVGPLEKPPFSATPQGQPLHPDRQVSDNVRIVGTDNKWYGAAGDVRNAGTKRHAGIDESIGRETKFTGLYKGTVKAAYPDGKLGGYVVVEFKDDKGVTWEQRSMHLKHLDVKARQKIEPGTVIGTGEGAGSIFLDPKTKKPVEPPHVHSEFRRNGRPVEPYSGLELTFNPKADLAESKRHLDRAQEEASKSAPTLTKP